MKLLYLVLVVFSVLGQISTYDFDDTESRNYLGVFTVVKFANDACASSTAGQNGTCLTSDECSVITMVASRTDHHCIFWI